MRRQQSTAKPSGTRRRGAAGGLGAATATTGRELLAPGQALYDATLRELLARHQGYLRVRKHLDLAEAECHDAGYALPLAAGMLAAVLSMRAVLDAEMVRITAQERLLEQLRSAAA